MNKTQRGFTLLELLLVLGVGVIVATLGVQTKIRQMHEEAVRGASSYLMEYVKAVRQYRATFNDKTNLGVQTGWDWLKSDTCGGVFGPSNPDPDYNIPGYLPCSFPTNVRFVPPRAVDLTVVKQALITIDPVIISGQVRGDMSGLVAKSLVASMTVAGGWSTVASVNMSPNPGPDQWKTIVDIYADYNNEEWIRRDGNNSPTATISWDGHDLADVGNLTAVLVNADDVNVTNTVTAGGDIRSINGDISADTGNVIAGLDVYGRRFIDTDNTSYLTDPNGLSILNMLDMDGRIHFRPSLGSITGSSLLDITATNDVRINTNNNGEVVVGSAGSYSPGFRSHGEVRGQNPYGWSFQGLSGAGSVPNSPRSTVGSAHLNDIQLGNGTWLSDRLPNWVHKRTYYGGYGTWVPKPSCPGGYAKIIVTPQRYRGFYEGPTGAWGSADEIGTFWAQDFGWYWRMYMTVNTKSGANGSFFAALGQTYCYYP